MNENNHDVDLVGPYVLDALEPEERRQFEQHLEQCEGCRREVAELCAVVDVLPLACEPVRPAPALRARIMDAVKADLDVQQSPQAGTETRLVPDQSPGRPKLRALPGGKSSSGRWAGSLLAAAAAVILLLGLQDLRLQQRVNEQQAAVASMQQVQRAIAEGATVSHLPGTGTEPAVAASMVQSRGSAVAYLVVRGLHPLETGHVYQFWLVRGAVPHSAGTFTVSGTGTQIVAMALPAGRYSQAAVTIEPGPHGSRAPTGPKVVAGRLIA